MITSPWLGFLRGVFLVNHLASTDNLARITKRQNTWQQKLTIHKRGPNKQYNIKHAMIYNRQS